jgi:putative flippase GtrA
MTSVPDKIGQACMRVLPASVQRKLQTEAGKRFARFVPVAVVAVLTSQLVLGLLTGPVQLSAGAAGVIASMTAALVSYLLSRWAWERKGRPDLLRETLPFWLVSAAVWAILGLTSHFASVWAHDEGYTHFKKHLAVQGAYFLMNCVTFVARFLIFHYVLFKDRKVAPLPVPVDAVPVEPPAREYASADAGGAGGDTGPMAALVPGDRGPKP